MVKGKTPKGKIKKNKLGVRKRKSKGRTRATPPTSAHERRRGRRNSRPKINNLGLDAEQSLVEQALRGSPDMTKLLEENDGKLFVPVGPENNEGASAAASSQSRQQSKVNQHLKKLDEEYGKWAAAEDVITRRDRRRSSRPQTPISTFHDYMKEQEREDQKDAEDKLFLNDLTGTTFDTNNSNNDFTFSFSGGKRKSRRRRKKSRRRRKKSRKRKTKRKSRRRRK